MVLKSMAVPMQVTVNVTGRSAVTVVSSTVAKVAVRDTLQAGGREQGESSSGARAPAKAKRGLVRLLKVFSVALLGDVVDVHDAPFNRVGDSNRLAHCADAGSDLSAGCGQIVVVNGSSKARAATERLGSMLRTSGLARRCA